MGIDSLFQSPSKHLASFFQTQVHLYRRDASLRDYFLALQLDSLTGARASALDRNGLASRSGWGIRGVDKLTRVGARTKMKADVLVCANPDFARKTETRFFVRSLLGIAETGAKIICLLPAAAACRDEIDSLLKSAGRAGQVEFIDPARPVNRAEQSTRNRVARMRGRSAFAEAVDVLEPHGLSPSRQALAHFEFIASHVESWERLAPWVEFDTVIARCHWLPLCSSVCRTALQRGKPVITFQQGVIGHTLDVPVTATKFVAFGETSASFLARANCEFFKATATPEPAVEFVGEGCLVDNLSVLPDQFDKQTLLVVDVPNAQADFYGIESECGAILELAERLLNAGHRIIIRPHPFWSDLNFEACKRLVLEHPSRCEISHPVWLLEDDLRRSSAVVGIFSGVLTVASACGLPAFFLKTKDGYSTGDLACFSEGQTVLPDAAFCMISSLLKDRGAYAAARDVALQNARAYYKNGANAKLNGAFFERLLSTKPERDRSRDSHK